MADPVAHFSIPLDLHDRALLLQERRQKEQPHRPGVPMAEVWREVVARGLDVLVPPVREERDPQRAYAEWVASTRFDGPLSEEDRTTVVRTLTDKPWLPKLTSERFEGLHGFLVWAVVEQTKKYDAEIKRKERAAAREVTAAPLSPSAPVTYTNTVGLDGRTVSSETAPVPWDAAVPYPQRFSVEEKSVVAVVGESWNPVTQLRFYLPAASRVSVSASANHTGGEWECFVDGEPWTVERTSEPLPAGFHTATIMGRRGATFGTRSVRVEVVS